MNKLFLTLAFTTLSLTSMALTTFRCNLPSPGIDFGELTYDAHSKVLSYTYFTTVGENYSVTLGQTTLTAGKFLGIQGVVVLSMPEKLISTPLIPHTYNFILKPHSKDKDDNPVCYDDSCEQLADYSLYSDGLSHLGYCVPGDDQG